MGKSIQVLLQVPPAARDINWLLDTLQSAIELEHSTIPPYLCYWWSIKDPKDPTAAAIRAIVIQEMLHMGLACNLMNAVGGHPEIDTPAFVPTYPGHLPGGCRPNLTVHLEGMSKHALETGMSIEYPEDGPVAEETDKATVVRVAQMANQGGHTIGEFYDAIEAFLVANPTVITSGTVQLQQPNPPGWVLINNLADARLAIQTIKEQGEGTKGNPMGTGGVLAHYYQYAQVYYGKKLQQSASGTWAYNGAAIPFPDAYPVAPIPAGGYPDFPLCQEVDEMYSSLLNNLHLAWNAQSTSDGNACLNNAIGTMFDLGSKVIKIMQTALPPGQKGNYGPTFRYHESPKQGFAGLVPGAQPSQLLAVVNFSKQPIGGTVGGVYSFDQWQTQYAFSQKQQISGPYAFPIDLPSCTSSIEIAVYYDSPKGEQVWDSKYGENYQATITNGKVECANW